MSDCEVDYQDGGFQDADERHNTNRFDQGPMDGGRGRGRGARAVAKFRSMKQKSKGKVQTLEKTLKQKGKNTTKNDNNINTQPKGFKGKSYNNSQANCD